MSLSQPRSWRPFLLSHSFSRRCALDVLRVLGFLFLLHFGGEPRFDAEASPSSDQAVRLALASSFTKAPEYRALLQQLSFHERPWQRERRRCGWDLRLGWKGQGRFRLRYGPFYRDFALPSQAKNEAVRAKTLLLLLHLFWDGVLEEQETRPFSCNVQTPRPLAISLPLASESPPTRHSAAPLERPSSRLPSDRPPKRRPPPLRRLAVVEPSGARETERPTSPESRPKEEPPKRLGTPEDRPTTRPSDARKKDEPPKRSELPVVQRPTSKPVEKGASRPAVDFTLGGSFFASIGTTGDILWGGRVSLLFWSGFAWRLRIEAGAGFNDFQSRGFLLLTNVAAFAEWVPIRWRSLVWEIHLGVSVSVAWIDTRPGGLLWLQPGLQGGTSLAWHPIPRLSLFLRLDLLYLPFLSSPTAEQTMVSLPLLSILPSLGFAWRF